MEAHKGPMLNGASELDIYTKRFRDNLQRHLVTVDVTNLGSGLGISRFSTVFDYEKPTIN